MHVKNSPAPIINPHFSRWLSFRVSRIPWNQSNLLKHSELPLPQRLLDLSSVWDTSRNSVYWDFYVLGLHLHLPRLPRLHRSAIHLLGSISLDVNQTSTFFLLCNTWRHFPPHTSKVLMWSAIWTWTMNDWRCAELTMGCFVYCNSSEKVFVLATDIAMLLQLASSPPPSLKARKKDDSDTSSGKTRRLQLFTTLTNRHPRYRVLWFRV